MSVTAYLPVVLLRAAVLNCPTAGPTIASDLLVGQQRKRLRPGQEGNARSALSSSCVPRDFHPRTDNLTE